MKKTFLFLFLLAVALSCAQQDEISDKALRQKRIEGALVKKNPNRLTLAKQVLLQNGQDGELSEIIAINKSTGFKSIAFVEINDRKNSRLDQWTGWLLEADGCFYHGTFTYYGNDPYDWAIFQPDTNYYLDNYVGNEPRCLSNDQLDSLC